MKWRHREVYTSELKQKMRSEISAACKRRYALKENCPMYGKHLSAEAKTKISRAHKGVRVGALNPMFGKRHTKKVLEKISLKMAHRVLGGWIANTNFETGIFSSEKMGEEFVYRSSWELGVYHMLENDLFVLEYRAEPFRLPYLFEDKRRNYIPDIEILYRDGVKKLIEIKPKIYVRYPINLAKFEAAEKYCQERNMLFEIWTEKELKEMKVL